MKIDEKMLLESGEPIRVLILDLSAFEKDDAIRQRRTEGRIVAMSNLICLIGKTGLANYINVPKGFVMSNYVAGIKVHENDNLQFDENKSSIIVGRFIDGEENIFMELTIIL